MMPVRQSLMDREEELLIYRELERAAETSQRELSRRLGISLGKVNFILHSLIEKGFVKVGNFRKSDNKLAYLYYLTPRGIEEKGRLTVYFLQMKNRQYERLREDIRLLEDEARQQGFPAEGL